MTEATSTTSTTQSDRLHSALNALSELLAEILDQGPDASLREATEATQGAAGFVTDWLTGTLDRIADTDEEVRDREKLLGRPLTRQEVKTVWAVALSEDPEGLTTEWIAQQVATGRIAEVEPGVYRWLNRGAEHTDN